ncbi:MAG TPA: adenylate/guanylate cyclase domain-containing protein [Steroidobacter sp.]|jgi:class 3 adenylate cyclase|nr:adenylate/guanylate cyclase domain-containing protein [Steroidobacteraceae bacterium]HLS81853.1 adenylate/guanylate cyclase domain-containing protein [Steroidobacter sp.]
MSTAFRTLLVTAQGESREWFERLTAGSEILLDEAVAPEQVVVAVAQRPPDLIVLDVDLEQEAFGRVCAILKANPSTVLLPLIALGRSTRRRLTAFEAGVDEFLTRQVRREDCLMRIRALLRASAARRRCAAEQLAEEVSRREEIRAAFRRYISPKLADQILADPELREAAFEDARRRTQAAIMFADMRGFTGMSERLPAPKVVELLNEFFALLTDIAFEYDGTVFSMAGDSLMVGFGVPAPQVDAAERAIFAARAMLEKFGALAERWSAEHGVQTGLGVGVNLGEVVAGNIGSPNYMNYTIVGDAVNVASRLGQRARAGEMLFSDTVKRALDRSGVDLGALALPSLVLRGRSAPIDIFCVPCRRRLDLRAHV